MTALHADISEFYARQMRLLDEGQADRWADTFTDDAVFGQDGKPPREGREAIAAGLRGAVARQSASGITRRHWLGMLAADPQPDGDVLTRYYALVVETPAGGGASLHLSTDCTDRLVRLGGGWKVAHRHVTHDGR
ncbi:hypothetical protein GCM10009836_35220 [Pseudonocardia ailaonensis]|uniref:SnoaL-like domain-containing protein n=1 Tax=Pseudonocardia ailaonensis TaxID=367279 RepID=A0ABN2N6U7_9PSEU